MVPCLCIKMNIVLGGAGTGERVVEENLFFPAIYLRIKDRSHADFAVLLDLWWWGNIPLCAKILPCALLFLTLSQQMDFFWRRMPAHNSRP